MPISSGRQAAVGPSSRPPLVGLPKASLPHISQARRLQVGRAQWRWATPANREGDHLEGLTRRADPCPACSGRIKSITRAHLGMPGGGRIAIVQPTCCLCPARAWPSPSQEQSCGRESPSRALSRLGRVSSLFLSLYAPARLPLLVILFCS